MRIAFEGLSPIAFAALIKPVVLNGVGGWSVFFPTSISFNSACFPSFSNTFAASSLSRKRRVECWAEKLSPFSVSSSALISQ